MSAVSPGLVEVVAAFREEDVVVAMLKADKEEEEEAKRIKASRDKMGRFLSGACYCNLDADADDGCCYGGGGDGGLEEGDVGSVRSYCTKISPNTSYGGNIDL